VERMMAIMAVVPDVALGRDPGETRALSGWSLAARYYLELHHGGENYP
jgi:hypothetical protein